MNLAYEARKDQTDKTGNSYIFHPFTVANEMEDLKHNMDLSRLSVVTERDLRRKKQYKRVLDLLSNDEVFQTKQ